MSSSGAEAPRAEQLGYLGLGMMGFPMAHRLLNAGYEVAVWNRSLGKATGKTKSGERDGLDRCTCCTDLQVGEGSARRRRGCTRNLQALGVKTWLNAGKQQPLIGQR